MADGAEVAVGVVEPLVPPEVVTNNMEGPIVFQSSRSIEELIANGPANCNVEEEVQVNIHKLREDIFDGNEQLVEIVENASSFYLRDFLRQIRSPPASSESATRNRCKKWIEAPSNQQRYILMSKAYLWSRFTQKSGRPWTALWGVAALILKIITDNEGGGIR